MKRYFHFLQKQPKYVQKIHAGFFAGIFTLAIAFVWLYYQYGIFNPQYLSDSGSIKTVEINQEVTESPFDVLKNIYKDAVERAKLIPVSSKAMLESSTTTYQAGE